MLEYFYGRRHSILNGDLIWWGMKQKKKFKRCLEAKRKSKLETTKKILAVWETKLLSKTPEKVLDFWPLDVVA